MVETNGRDVQSARVVEMTCRHGPDDISCSSHPDNVARRYAENARDRAAKSATPDAAQYQILDVLRHGKHLVLKVRYPNCARCSYDGQKVLVFLDVTEVDVLRWREIDPHFRDPKTPRTPAEAPSPAARFPASPDGWADALAYAGRK